MGYKLWSWLTGNVSLQVGQDAKRVSASNFISDFWNWSPDINFELFKLLFPKLQEIDFLKISVITLSFEYYYKETKKYTLDEIEFENRYKPAVTLKLFDISWVTSFMYEKKEFYKYEFEDTIVFTFFEKKTSEKKIAYRQGIRTAFDFTTGFFFIKRIRHKPLFEFEMEWYEYENEKDAPSEKQLFYAAYDTEFGIHKNMSAGTNLAATYDYIKITDLHILTWQIGAVLKINF